MYICFSLITASFLCLLAFNRLVILYRPSFKTLIYIKRFTLVTIVLLVIFSGVSSYYSSKDCPRFCISNIVVSVVYLLSTIFQIIFYLAITMIVMKRRVIIGSIRIR